MSRLFVSHAVKDESLVEEFVELLQVGVGIHPGDVFCSSLPGMGIPTGKDFVEFIRSKVVNPDLVLLVLSEEFFKSPFCNNEVGASWGLSIPIYPILVPPIGYGDLRGVLYGKQAAKLDDKEALNDLRDRLTEIFKPTPLGTSHWERKRDKFLGKLTNLLRGSHSKVEPVSKPLPTDIVTTSGPLFKLGDLFFEAERVRRPAKDKLSVEFFSSSGAEEAALNSLRPHQHGGRQAIGYAYQNDGGLAQIENVTSTSLSGRNSWTIDLALKDSTHNAFSEISYERCSADDIAEMRAGRLLVNDPPPPKKKRGRGITDDLIEYAIVGNDQSVQIDGCIIQSILSRYSHDRLTGMRRARLEAVFRLLATGIVASVHELSLGPISEKGVHVKFQGQRPRHYQNVDPEIISIDADCDLT